MSSQPAITKQEVLQAQEAWGAAVVGIGAATKPEDAHRLAEELVHALYVTDGTLLFRPTLAQVTPFRRTAECAVSYFVGGSSQHEEDHGFALAPWSSVRFDNAGVVSLGQTAQAMGDYYFGKPDGTELKVQYSFVYVRAPSGALRIQLHHSALPYSD